MIGAKARGMFGKMEEDSAMCSVGGIVWYVARDCGQATTSTHEMV
jgi:hypothetical protein